MRLLVVTGRPFRPGGKGDQVRLAQIVEALAQRHTVTILQPSGDDAGTPAGVRFDAVRVTTPERLAGAVAAWLRGRPAQTGWCAPPRFARRVRRHARSHDAVLYVTSRVFASGAGLPVAVDHVDTLSENARRRATSYKLRPLRWLWRVEARRLRRWERLAAATSSVQIVTSPADAEALPLEPAPVVVPIGVKLDGIRARETTPPRDIDVIFTGDMRYPPNRDAAAWLATEILPRLVERRRDVRAVFAGRAADTLPDYAGVDIASDVPDLGTWLACAKIAVAPLRIGTGVPNKVLEAARAGAAVVLTPSANAGLGFSPAAVGLAATAEMFADELANLLYRPDLRVERCACLAYELERFSLDAVTERYVDALDALAAKT